MSRIVRCPECCGIIEFDESYDTFWNDDEAVLACAGHCSDCGQNYLYDEVYTFSHISGLQKEVN